MKRVISALGNNWSLVVIAIVCIGFLLADFSNHRFWMHDFKVYYQAGLRLIHEGPLYNVYDENPKYIYKYSPVAPLFFIPFTILPFEIAKITYWLFLTAIVLLSFMLMAKIIVPKQPLTAHNKVFMFGALILALHFLRELHLGQVNYLLLTSFVACCYFYITGMRVLSMCILAITIFFKPFGFIFIPYLIVKKNYKELGVFAISLILLFFIPIIFYPSWNDFIGLYKGWLHELVIEMSHKQSLLQDGNHTVFSVLARYTPIRYLLTTELASQFYQLAVLCIIAVLYYFYQKENKFIVTNFAFLIALIPLFSFTSENAFCFTGLAVFSILFNFKQLTLVEKALSITGFIFIGGNFSEILGKSTSRFLDQISLISFGALALLVVLYTARMRKVM